MDDVQKEMLQGWKSSWDTYVKAFTMFQEQGEKMLDLLFAQSETTQEETKKLIKEWLANTKEAQKAYLKAAEENFQKIEELIAAKAST